MRRAMLLQVSLLLAVSSLLPARVSAQTSAMVDVGSFSLTANGERVGREQFSIRHLQGPDGRVVEFRAESAIGTRRSAFRLEVDSSGQPLRYAVEVKNGVDVQLRLGGQRVRGRFATLARGLRGEAAREYLLVERVHVLDEGAVHQYAALLEHYRGIGTGTTVELPILAPLENLQSRVRIILEARDDAVTIAGTRRAAWRWKVTPNGGEPRLVWTDAEGRLLRLLIGATGFEALRDDVPR
jgi:hypothetical protein